MSAESKRFHAAWVAADGSGGMTGAARALFPWWSVSKTLLAVCALRLVEDGRLDLDAPRSGQTFTLRHLLQHRAGIPDYGGLGSYRAAVARREVAWSRSRLLAEARAERLEFPPGTGWAYSNIGYLFVRDAIEEATGVDWGQALRVLAPALALASVRLARQPADFSTLFWPALRDYDPGWVYHGCLVGTAEDAARVMQALFQGRILKAETLRTMVTRHPVGGALPGRPWTECGYGLGLMSGTMGKAGQGTALRAMGHSGAGPGAVNAVYHFPDRPIPVTVAVFTSGDDEGAAEYEAERLARDLPGQL